MAVSVELENPMQLDIIDLLQEGLTYLRDRFSEDECATLGLAELQATNTRFWTLRLNDLPVGCVALVEYGQWAEIKRMYLRPAQRGIGGGKLLLGAIIDYAHEHRIASLRLQTTASLDAAIRLYKASGFREIPPFGDYIHSSISLCMERTTN